MSGLIMPTRRGLLQGLGALSVAPAIVKATSLMPISVIKPDYYDIIATVPIEPLWQIVSEETLDYARTFSVIARHALDGRFYHARHDVPFTGFGYEADVAQARDEALQSLHNFVARNP